MSLGGASVCPTCQNKVYFNDEKPYGGKKWHKKCFACSKSDEYFFIVIVLTFSVYLSFKSHFPILSPDKHNLCVLTGY